ncbi:protein translocase SEC61 complex subunit gamma [Candidatus Woesearchaeota archaeon]|nr:protein translocase SEC61 complex subunit gamma [Candidatus Woesearchaeota archaeon]
MFEQPQDLTWKQKLAHFYKECKRVLSVTRKPDQKEYTTIVKISGAGILLIGFIGFVIYAIKELLF